MPEFDIKMAEGMLQAQIDHLLEREKAQAAQIATMQEELLAAARIIAPMMSAVTSALQNDTIHMQNVTMLAKIVDEHSIAIVTLERKQ